MLGRLRLRLALLACGLITSGGLAAGVFAQCNGNYCYENMAGCTPLHTPFQDNCCRSTNNGWFCFTCTRDMYWCMGGELAGSAYGCSGAGAVCS